MKFSYSLYGLHAESNVAIDALSPLSVNSGSPPDLKILLGVSPHVAGEIPSGDQSLTYASSFRNEQGHPYLRMYKLGSDAFLYLSYGDGTEFWFDRAGTKLWAVWTQSGSLEKTLLYLLGPILGLMLRYRGIVCLHASAVAIGGEAAVFTGPEEAGKSTTAAALANRGCYLLSEDVLPLSKASQEFLVFPGYPEIRLWPDSAEALFGPAHELPHFIPDFDKRRLSPADREFGFCEHPVPVRAIYVLGDRCADDRAPFLEEIDRRTALMTLVANSYASNLLDGKARAEEFAFLGDLAARFPVRRIRSHKDRDRLNQLCELIFADFQLRSSRANPL